MTETAQAWPRAIHPTTVREVTFFEDRAEVVRTADVVLEEGERWLVFSGVTPFIDERSVRVRLISGKARVLGARIKRRVHHEETLGRADLDEREGQLRRAEHRLQEANDATERARLRGEGVRELLDRWTSGLSTVPRGLRASNGHENGRKHAWRGAYDALAQAEAEVLGAADAARVQRVQAEDEVAHAEARLREGNLRHVRQEALVEVRVRIDEPGEARFEIVYRTPGALWRPEHVARAGEGTTAEDELELLTWATVWQRTGEDWNDVRVRLSTARPAHQATPPLLEDDRLVTRRKSDADRRRTVVEGREQEILSAAVSGAKNAVEQMPGVDDGGVPLVYEVRARADVRSDGRPVRLEIGHVRLPARVERVVYPELARVAHIRATATLSEGGPLLAGPVHVHHAGTAAGRVRTRFVAQGDPFELGLGTDDAIRVRRDVEKEDETSSILGTQRRKRTVTVWLSNLSREPKRLRVTERVPVSEIDGVDIDVPAQHTWQIDARDGFATCDVELAGDETRKIVLVYELRATSKMVLPDL
ncbi:DUF4139 domain-containing protein [Pendulispora rubella]|uniref:DUF4139 domain-containing protein n=1 Tax=Pendulispora rubella TaxID=2741070 RepID=A0ABZ2LJQ5_9BACT